MNRPLPKEFLDDLRISPAAYGKPLCSLIQEVLENPDAAVDETERYWALYEGRHVAVIIEPQRNRILLGFFAKYVKRLSPPPKIRPVLGVLFRNWNRSKGGLVGYAIEGSGDQLSIAVEEIRRLIDESYRWVGTGL